MPAINQIGKRQPQNFLKKLISTLFIDEWKKRRQKWKENEAAEMIRKMRMHVS